MIFGCLEGYTVFLNAFVSLLREIRNIKDFTDVVFKLEDEIKSRQMESKQSPTNLGCSCIGTNCWCSEN